MTTIDGKSPNLAHETKATIRDLLMEPAICERLKQICPDAFCDGDLQMDLLLEAMGKYHTTENIKELVVDENERYEFRWSGKQKAKYESQKSSTGTLRPCPEESKNWDTTQNLYIEGDNLEVLKILKRAYAGKIKMIYIDPPYNTGKDFVYKDDYTDNLKNYLEQTGQLTAEGKPKSSNTAADGRFHTNWLNMMYPRLRLARELLSDDGVIFISIDDNEQANLKKLCDEVFCGDNFVGELIIETATDNNATQINIEHEYIICFAKDKLKLSAWERKSAAALKIIEQYNLISKKYNQPEDIEKELRKWIKQNKDSLPQVCHYNNVDRKGVYSSSQNSSNTKPGDYNYDIIHPITKKACPTPAFGWRWPESTFLEYKENDEVDWGKDEKTQPHIKKRIETAREMLRSLIYEDGRSSTKSLDDLFNGIRVFENPKSVSLLSRIIDFIAIEDNTIILDFFSGSSTTAESVIQLNNEDCKNRKYIMVQFEEKIEAKIAKSGKNKGKLIKCVDNNAIAFLDSIHRPHNLCEIGKERIRRAGEKIIEDAKKAGKDVSGLDVGFKVFKLSESNMNKWHLELADLKDKNDMEKAAIAALRDSKNTIRRREIEAENAKRKAAGLAPFDIDLCVIYEWLLKYGVMPDCQIETAQIGGHKVYSVSGGAFMICLEHGLNRDWAKSLVTYRDECLSGMDEATKSDAWHVMVADECFDDTRDMQNVAKTLHDNGLKDEHWIVV